MPRPGPPRIIYPLLGAPKVTCTMENAADNVGALWLRRNGEGRGETFESSVDAPAVRGTALKQPRASIPILSFALKIIASQPHHLHHHHHHHHYENHDNSILYITTP